MTTRSDSTSRSWRRLVAKARGWVRVPWSRHPALRMWEGHELALVCYRDAINDEWRRRGFRGHRQLRVLQSLPRGVGDSRPPLWWDATMFWTESPAVGYVWP